MSKCFVLAGKIGDILSCCPFLLEESKKQKNPTAVVTSRKYSDVLSGLDYVSLDILDYDWDDLESYIKHAKRNYEKAIISQSYGRNVSIQHRHPSFQYEQWGRSGYLHLWDKLPLIIPRPPNAKELVERYMGKRPAILFADKGESSPFLHGDYLAGLLQDSFGKTHDIVRLSTIRLDKFTDFVALYDAASILVVTETAHLHLSKASKTPTFALVTDTPERWHGSAWSKQFKLHIRYSQFQRRSMELIEGIKSVL